MIRAASVSLEISGSTIIGPPPTLHADGVICIGVGPLFIHGTIADCVSFGNAVVRMAESAKPIATEGLDAAGMNE